LEISKVTFPNVSFSQVEDAMAILSTIIEREQKQCLQT